MNNWNFRGEGAEDLSVHHQLCTYKERNVVISTSYLTTQVCRLPMWFAIAMLPPQLHCTLGTMVETKGSITQKKLGKNPRFAQFEQERKPADTTPSLSLSLFWFSFPYHSHRVKRNL